MQSPIKPHFSSEFRFNGLMIIGIGAAFALAQHLTFRHLTDKQHVAAQIHFLQHFAGEHSICMVSQVQKAIVTPPGSIASGEFVGIPTGLHTKMTHRFKGNSVRQGADVKAAARLDHLPGQISLLHRDRKLCRCFRYLKAGIDNAAVIRFSVPGGQYVQSIGQLVKCHGIGSRFILLSESNAPADPSEPCRGEPRHEPFRERCRGWHPDRSSWRR